MDDHELLRQYAQNRSQDAFRTLVERHLPMVYGAACRLSRNPHLAEDVAQKVFITLAKKSSSISSGQLLAGWIYNTTRYVALHEMRTEQRRQEREQTALTMQDLAASSEPDKIMEQLEPALSELDEDDRGALVLRYLENRSLREVGEELRISEDAARMRVNRALEKLRNIFGRRGVAVTSVVLLAALSSTNASAAVPAGLVASTISAATATSATITTLSWLTSKTIAAIACASLLAGTGTYLLRQIQINQAQAQNRQLSIRLQQAEADRSKAADEAEMAKQELKHSAYNARELAQLRNETSRLRQAQDAQPTLVQSVMTNTDGEAGDVIYLNGEFLHPGPWQIPTGFKPTAATTVLRAGGTTHNADLAHVRLLHNVHGTRSAKEINFQALLEGDSSTSDVPITAGDIIVIPGLTNKVADPSLAAEITNDAQIVPGETLAVSVEEDKSLSMSYPVRKGGYILMRNIGRIPVAGMDLAGVETTIAARLADNQISNAHVKVQYGNEQVPSGKSVIYLEGEYLHPGPWLIPARFTPTVVTTILRSGGTTPNSDLTHVRVLRNVGGQGSTDEINVKAIMDGTSQTSDLILNAGDIILIPAKRGADTSP